MPSAVDLVGHHEVAGRADRRGQAPADTDEVDVGGEPPANSPSTSMIPAIAIATPESVRLLGPASGGGPQPTHDQDRCGVLEQQRDADRQVVTALK